MKEKSNLSILGYTSRYKCNDVITIKNGWVSEDFVPYRAYPLSIILDKRKGNSKIEKRDS